MPEHPSTAVPVSDPGVAVLHLKEEIAASGNYFAAHEKELFRAGAGTAVSLAAALLLLWGAKMLLKRFPLRKLNWKHQLARALFLPLVWLGCGVTILVCALPLIRSFPAEAALWTLRLFYTAFAAFAAWGLVRLVRVLDSHIRTIAEKRDNTLDNLTVGIAGSVLKVAIIFITALFVGQNIFDINISALLASAGVIGLALALAAKDTVSNFFGTLVIVADTPFRIGDRIECGSVCGIVQNVGMRSSRIVTDDGTRCTVPNSTLTNAAVFQRNRRGHLKRVIDLALTYDTTAEKMEEAVEILHNIMDDFHGRDLPEFSPRIFFSSFGSFSLDLRCILFFKTESFEEEEKLLSEVNFAILREFGKAGIEFAFPTRTVYVKEASLSSCGASPQERIRSSRRERGS